MATYKRSIRFVVVNNSAWLIFPKTFVLVWYRMTLSINQLIQKTKLVLSFVHVIVEVGSMQHTNSPASIDVGAISANCFEVL